MEVSSQLQTLAALTPRNNSLVPIKKVGFFGPRGGLNALEKRKKKCSCSAGNQTIILHSTSLLSGHYMYRFPVLLHIILNKNLHILSMEQGM
jgi:hypothetical protein